MAMQQPMQQQPGCWPRDSLVDPEATWREFQCVVCGEVAADLLESSSCGHFFGSGCVPEESRPCPAPDCQAQVDRKSLHPVVYLRRRIDRLQHRCDRCGLQLSLGDLASHRLGEDCQRLSQASSCPFEVLGCESGSQPMRALERSGHMLQDLAEHGELSLQALLRLQSQLAEAREKLLQLAGLLERSQTQLQQNEEQVQQLVAENTRKQSRIGELEARAELSLSVIEKQRAELQQLSEAFEQEQERRRQLTELDGNGIGVFLSGPARVGLSAGLMDSRLPLGKTLQWLVHQGDAPVDPASLLPGSATPAAHHHQQRRESSPGHVMLQAVSPALHKVAREGADRALLIMRADDDIGVDLLQPIPKWFTVDLASFDVCAKAGKSSNLMLRLPKKDRHSLGVMRKIEQILTELGSQPLSGPSAGAAGGAAAGDLRAPRHVACVCMASSAMQAFRQPSQRQDALNTFLAAGLELQPVLQPQLLLPGLGQSALQAACSGLLFFVASWEEF